jgi:hypothetical protein
MPARARRRFVVRRRSRSTLRRDRRWSPHSGHGCAPAPAGAAHTDNELKGRDAAGRVVPGEQEAYGEGPDADGLLGRIDVEVGGLMCHVDSVW